jgi:hypothetical protein
LNARYYKWLWVVHHWFNDGQPRVTCNTGHSMMDNPELLVIPGIQWWITHHHWMPGITSDSGLSIIECPVLQVILGCPSLNARYYKWFWVVHHWMPGITSDSGLSIIECPDRAFNDGQPIFTCNTGHAMMDNPESLVIPGIQWWTTHIHL